MRLRAASERVRMDNPPMRETEILISHASFGVSAMFLALEKALAASASRESMAGFGFPVVPDVRRMAAMFSGTGLLMAFI